MEEEVLGVVVNTEEVNFDEVMEEEVLGVVVKTEEVLAKVERETEVHMEVVPGEVVEIHEVYTRVIESIEALALEVAICTVFPKPGELIKITE